MEEAVTIGKFLEGWEGIWQSRLPATVVALFGTAGGLVGLIGGYQEIGFGAAIVFGIIGALLGALGAGLALFVLQIFPVILAGAAVIGSIVCVLWFITAMWNVK
jgi:amino acid transporter